jgi:hypothetical protein
MHRFSGIGRISADTTGMDAKCPDNEKALKNRAFPIEIGGAG